MEKNEYEQFKKVFNEVLLPIFDEHKEDITKVLDNNPEFKSKVETKVKEILRNKKMTLTNNTKILRIK